MKISKSDILPLLEKLMPVTGKANGIPSLACFRISASSGTLSVRATNMDEWMISTMPCEDGKLDFAVNAGKFIMSVKSCRDTFEITETLGTSELTVAINIVSGFKMRIPTTSVEEFPKMPEMKQKAIGLHPEDLRAALESVSWIADYSTGKADFSEAIYLQCAAKTIEAVATNRACVVRRVIDSMCGDMTVLLPGQFSSHFSEALRMREAKVWLGENYISVRSEQQGEYHCRLAEYAWPVEGVRAMFTTPRDIIGEIAAAELMQHLAVCSSFAKDRYDSVILDFSADMLWIGFRNDSTGGETPIVYESEIAGSFKPFKGRLSLRYLYETIKNQAGSAKVVITAANAKNVPAGQIMLAADQKPSVCIALMTDVAPAPKTDDKKKE